MITRLIHLHYQNNARAEITFVRQTESKTTRRVYHPSYRNLSRIADIITRRSRMGKPGLAVYFNGWTWYDSK